MLLTLKFNLAGAKRIISINFGVLIGIQNRFVNFLVLNNASTWCSVGRRERQKEKKSDQSCELGAGGGIQCVYLAECFMGE